MLELERLDVRVVSGRVTQKDPSTSESDNDEDHPNPSRGSSKNNTALASSQQQQQQQQLTDDLLNQHRRNSITASLLNVADLARGNDRRNRMASMDSGFFFNRAGSLGLGPNFNLNMSGSLGGDQNRAVDKKDISTDARIPSVRPYVGGGSAAAYEATREDYYRKVAERRKSQNKDGGAAGGVLDHAKALTGSRGSIGGLSNDAGALGSLNQIGAGVGGMNQQMNLPLSLPTNASKHYEMLKLHHMNLLNEIQETTLMMNLYQQQHVQQLQHDQMKKKILVDPQLSLLSQQQHLLAGAGGLSQDGVINQRSGQSLGLGSLMGQRNSLSQVGSYVGNDVVLSRRRSSDNNSGGSNNNINNNSSIIDAMKGGGNHELGPAMDQHHSISQIIANAGNDGGNSSSGSNKNNIMTKNTEDTIIDNISKNNINDAISNGKKNDISIAGNSISDHIRSPACALPLSVNNINSDVQRSDEIPSMGNAAVSSTQADQLKRIKDEIAERQRMVDQLERMEPKQKRTKIEI